MNTTISQLILIFQIVQYKRNLIINLTNNNIKEITKIGKLNMNETKQINLKINTKQKDNGVQKLTKRKHNIKNNGLREKNRAS